ncbi:solute carrier family 35 member B1 [Sodiomyces alkalinus F11]|uniref:UDP-galactose transporter homolog 1 n=1 Tax=Sodiomyces alkalinus (strain CBS 110278 / VKM F-3762 / F11) TaxID=1314773 RepID=A0A3N2PMS5_SODAK|nr:solute carrier family 35 member B1 [Sodiomyces alkalinus F11]ROT35730.1 solute carrier family 35 member B1 [Sodiomyces alkalinus F11]
MARSKQATPIRREASSEYFSKYDGAARKKDAVITKPVANGKIVAAPVTAESTSAQIESHHAVAFKLLVAVTGIYVSFITWGYLQEKLTTTRYGPVDDPEVFQYPVFLNTIQSLFAAVTGFLYLCWSASRTTATDSTTPRSLPPIFPSRRMVLPLILVSVTSSLASPFGYASLAHIDYITYLLAKSCKLLPVMFLHTTLFGRRYPLYKYLVVAAVTLGVAIFTLHTGSAKKSRRTAANPDANLPWGLLLLGINLLFDGLTNTTQDYIFSTFKGYTGPQMMCANNLVSSAVTTLYLLLSPWLVRMRVGEWLGMDVASSTGELVGALAFMGRNPEVWFDVLGFATCGAIGQVFIFYTLSTFSSVVLVTVTVTRKMVTMALSVFAFGHRLTGMQWLGVGLVFGAIGAEARIATVEKQKKVAAAKSKLEKTQ